MKPVELVADTVYHQGVLPYRDIFLGTQCCSIAMMAGVISRVHAPISWSPHVMNLVLKSGHVLHKTICEEKYGGRPVFLLHSDLPRFLTLTTNALQLNSCVLLDTNNSIYGLLREAESVQIGCSSVQCLSTAVAQTFQTYPCALLTVDDVTCCLVKHEEQIFVYDSHSRDMFGMSTASGSAVLLRFRGVNNLLCYLQTLYQRPANAQLELTGFIVCATYKFSSLGAADEFSWFDTTVRCGFSSCNRLFTCGCLCITCQHLKECSSECDQVTESCLDTKIDDIINTVCEQVAFKQPKTAALFISAEGLAGAESTESGHTRVANGADKRVDVIINSVCERISLEPFSTVVRHLSEEAPAGTEAIEAAIRSVVSYSQEDIWSMPQSPYSAADNFRCESCPTVDLRTPRRQEAPTVGSIRGESCLATSPGSDRLLSSRPSINCIIELPSSQQRRPYSSDPQVLFNNFLHENLLYACHSCRMLLYSDKISILKYSSCITDQLLLEKGMSVLCGHCIRSLNKDQTPPRSAFNNLEVGDVPMELESLNVIEKRFIAKIQTYLTVLMLSSGQQHAQKGMAIHFPCETHEVINVLPNAVADLSPVLCVSGNSQSIIRPKVIYRALLYLVKNNLLYKDTKINFGACQENNGNTGLERNEFDVEEVGMILEDYDAPGVSVYELLASGRIVFFPKSTESPVDYCGLKNAEALAFPWLFPQGICHRDSDRKVKLSTLQYYWTRLYNMDKRFRSDISYLLASCNAFEKASLVQQIQVQMRIMKTQVHTQGQLDRVTAGDIKEISRNSGLLENSYMFMKQVRGTCAYWKDKLYDLLAMIKFLGPPDIFLTLSCDDNWPDLMQALAVDMKEVVSITEAVRKCPLIVAWHFERRWKFFLRHFICSANGPFGKVLDHWARIEFQNRGSPHVHSFLWLEGVPSINRNSPSEEICKFIDSVISCRIPQKEVDPDLYDVVTKKHTHQHRPRCMRRSRCRYNFPRRPSGKTRLTPNVDLGSRSRRFKFYEVARTKEEEMINEYNPAVARAWNANTDCQLVGGYIGAAYYACSYICKAEPDGLKQKIAEIVDSFQTQQNISKSAKMFKVGIAVLKYRQMSAVEACYRLGHLTLLYTSRDVVMISGGFLENRMKLLKPRSDWTELPAESTNIFKDSIVDHYHNRPHELETLCLYCFASRYRIDYKKLSGNPRNERINLLNGSVRMVRRNHDASIRTPHYKEGSEDYYYTLLLLYVPHRSEEELLSPYDCASVAFFHKFGDIDVKLINSEANYTELLRSLARVRMNQTVLEEYNKAVESRVLDEYDCDSIDDDGAGHCQSAAEGLAGSHTEPYSSVDELLWHRVSLGVTNIEADLNSLTVDQRRVLRYIQLSLERNCPFRIFITGDAGTGKSFLFRFLTQYLRLNDTTVGGLSSVVVCAPTGIAARNVSGQTIHSVFSIPVQHVYEPKYEGLSVQSQQRLRKRFCGVKTLLIDEVSMVSSKLLRAVHRRLGSIRQI